jgi:phosphatidate cytidylyltransferase
LADGEPTVEAVDVPLKAKTSDLGVRTLTAVAMVAVAGAALWLGDWFWALFLALIASGVLWEWRALVRGFAASTVERVAWNTAGFIYIVSATFTLLVLRGEPIGGVVGFTMVLLVVGGVVATDIGAYFVGRAIGGPKIAPKVSPSKTWAGLLGGILGASLLYVSFLWWTAPDPEMLLPAALTGTAVAVIAQLGDFFESWMKRRAGVKDSGRLLPGHGGLFDRVDGLLAVCFVWAVFVIPVFFGRLF